MAMNLEALAAEAMKLALEDRAQLASRLLLSLEEPSESEIERLWLEEAERRLREFREGRVQGIPGDQAARLIYESESTSPKSVLLFFITADVQKMNRNEIGGCYDGTKGGGYVWCEPYGHFLWSEFHPILRDVLVGLKNDAPDEFTTLATA